MGVSTLHHHFRALTTTSPLQYQKQLHLQAARERMLMDGLDAASAAFEVGYESATQFNREYSRFFGQPPMRDIRALRSSGALYLSRSVMGKALAKSVFNKHDIHGESQHSK
jgi:AraC-like DNA-binding protein